MVNGLWLYSLSSKIYSLTFTADYQCRPKRLWQHRVFEAFFKAVMRKREIASQLWRFPDLASLVSSLPLSKTQPLASNFQPLSSSLLPLLLTRLFPEPEFSRLLKYMFYNGFIFIGKTNVSACAHGFGSFIKLV